LASLGHTDTVVIGDCGLPIPEGVERVDLAVVQGLPRFAPVVEAIAEELVVQKIFGNSSATKTPSPQDYKIMLLMPFLVRETLKFIRKPKAFNIHIHPLCLRAFVAELLRFLLPKRF
jgi:D-ribose pyranose/furanose isomerase RbsD